MGGYFIPVVILLVCVAGVASYLISRDDGPGEWDERVVDLVAFVEEERGHDFDRVVTVNFLDAEAYTRASTGVDDLERPEEDDASTADAIGELRAFGLVSGDFDLDEMGNTLVDVGTLAFYSPETKEIYVRGTEVTPALRATLVHELVHALQDQRFDLARLSELEGHEAWGLRSVAEGDAGRIEDLYVERLDDADAESYEQTIEQDHDETIDLLDEAVPSRIQALFQMPYLYGPPMVMLTDARGGNAAVDRLFTDIPSEFAYWYPAANDPEVDLAADQTVLDVPLPDGAEAIEEGSFGPMSWYLVLVGAVEPKAAMAAVDTITADGFHSHRVDDRVCIDLRARSSDADLIASALDRWVSHTSGHDAETGRDGDVVTFRTCDPGPNVGGDGGDDVSMEMIVLPALRASAFAEVAEVGMPEKVAACYAEGLIAVLSVEELTSPDLPDDFQRRSDDLVRGCIN